MGDSVMNTKAARLHFNIFRLWMTQVQMEWTHGIPMSKYNPRGMTSRDLPGPEVIKVW